MLSTTCCSGDHVSLHVSDGVPVVSFPDHQGARGGLRTRLLKSVGVVAPDMSTREPEPRTSHAAVGLGQRLYIWGGKGVSVAESKRMTSKVESFDLSTESWEKARPIRGGPLPDGLCDFALTTVAPNTAYLFGGNDGTCQHNTIYHIDLNTLECKKVFAKNPSEAPQGKSGCAMVYDDDRLIVFGGHSGEMETDELHVFDLKTSRWSAQPTSGKNPGAVCDHTFTKISPHKALVFGGRFGALRTNSAYILDLETWNWTELSVRDRPPVKSSHTACCIAGPATGQDHPLLMVIGGVDHSGTVFGDVWVLDLDSLVWTEVSLPDAMAPRSSHSAVVFGSGADFRIVVLFGGRGAFRGKILSKTTLLTLKLRNGSWDVISVIKPHELGRPDERLRDQMKNLELSPAEKEKNTENVATHAEPNPTPQPQTRPIIDLKDIEIGHKIGQGGFGAVYKGKWKTKGNMPIAIKVCLGNVKNEVPREVQILADLPSHPNVITFFGVGIGRDGIGVYIITELAEKGSLFHQLHEEKEAPTTDQSLTWALQVASGVGHLHANHIVHRDLKSANVLLSDNMTAKVCDFGTARVLTATTTQTNPSGTYRWMAPEVMAEADARINHKCDVFSFGMILYELFVHKIPYENTRGNGVVAMKVLQGIRPELPPTLPKYLCSLLRACWDTEPHQRPTIQDVTLAIQNKTFE